MLNGYKLESSLSPLKHNSDKLPNPARCDVWVEGTGIKSTIITCLAVLYHSPHVDRVTRCTKTD